METLEYYRKLCLKQQTELKKIMSSMEQPDAAIHLFLKQHAMLHSREVAQTELWSYEDEIFKDLPEDRARYVSRKEGHSIAWLIWHIARCEDITMNLLVADSPQVLMSGSWLERMKISACDTGNTMSPSEIAGFSEAIDIKVLRDYRAAAGRRTREIVKHLQPVDLKRKVIPSRLQRVIQEGAVLEGAMGIVDYWGKRDVAGLLLMPATRHPLVHLNEAQQVKTEKI